MNERNAALCEQLKAKGITPTLAVVRVGEREDDLSYERGVIARCGKVGVEVKQFLLPADASQDDLLKVIAEVNAEDTIHGCLLFRPLPKQFNDRTVRAALAPERTLTHHGRFSGRCVHCCRQHDNKQCIADDVGNRSICSRVCSCILPVQKMDKW